MRSFYFIFTLLLVTNAVLSQTATTIPEKYIKEDRAKGLVYKREFTMGGKVISNGWGITADIGKIINIHRTRIFEFEFDGIKDPRQQKQPSSSLIGNYLNYTAKDFYYGLQNQFFALKAGYGNKMNIADKAEKSGVALSFVYVGGVSLGLLKPYYLDLANVIPVNDSTYQVQIVSQRYNANPQTGNAQNFLNWDNIIGASGFGKGLNEIQPIPGICGKAALNFEWGAKDSFITAIEAGVTTDIYYKKVPIMIDQTNHFMFWAAYLAFQLGKRY